MLLTEWAAKWSVPAEALTELKAGLGVAEELPPQSVAGCGGSEATAQMDIRLEATEKGLRLWRNNVGATYDEKGNYIRYGLANDSAKLNNLIKSSDLIGIRPLLITPGHVGHVVGQFVAREVKKQGWVYRGTHREKAQLKFLQFVEVNGGDAAFATGRGTL